MPHVVNGCGTWYYGKKNLERHEGVCRSCGRTGVLESYDTRLYIVIVMVPIIPLARKRIIEKCPSCRRHMALPYSQWQGAQQRAGDAIDAYRASPQSTERAQDAIRAAVTFRNLPALLALGPEIEKNLPNDAATLCMLGSAFEIFGRLQDTERVLRRALEVKDDDDISDLLGRCLLRQNRVDEAEDCLRYVAEKVVPDRVDSLFQLAQRYQMQGDHERALAWFEQCELVNPGFAQTSAFRRLREESQKRLGTREPVKPGQLMVKEKRAVARKRLLKAAMIILPLAIVAWAALAWFFGASRQVYLVSGVSRPYAVKVNGKTYTLQPESEMSIRVPEGNVRIQTLDPRLSLPPETVLIHSEFWTRLWAKHAFVINPDHAAILRWARIYYFSHRAIRPTGSGISPKLRYAGGQTLETFDGVDYPFETAPQSVQMDSTEQRTSRTTLSLVHSSANVDAVTVLLNLSKKIGKQNAAEIARRRLLANPQEMDYLVVLEQTMQPREIADFLRPGLARRPLEMSWHRSYQTMMEVAGLTEQAEREYDAMLKSDPDNGELLYLTGRVTRDIDRGLELTRRSAASKPPCPYAFYSLCGYYLVNGQFDMAAQWGDRAIKAMPKNTEVRTYCRRALLADGQYNRVAQIAREDTNEPFPACLAAYSDEVYALAMAGKTGEVGLVLMGLKGRIEQFQHGASDEILNWLRADLDYCTGNPRGLVARLKGSSDPQDRLMAHLSSGEIDEAEKDIEALKPVSSRGHLLMYIAAVVAQRADIAPKHLTAAIALLEKGTSEDRAFAAALLGKDSMPIAQLLRQRGGPGEKVVLLTALGLHRPPLRQACFKLAKKLNYDRRFPHWLLTAAMAKSRMLKASSEPIFRSER